MSAGTKNIDELPGEFRNSITTKEDHFPNASLIHDWTNGMRHSIPVSATFTLLILFK